MFCLYPVIVIFDNIASFVIHTNRNLQIILSMYQYFLSFIASYNGVRNNQKLVDDEECDGWIVSSESCSFQSIGASYYREVLPGEIVKITKEGFKSMAVVPRPKDVPSAFCIFEYVYFARPDSIFEGNNLEMYVTASDV